MSKHLLRFAPLGFVACAVLIGCGGGGSSAPTPPNPGATATPNPGATATPTPGPSSTPTPGATATPTPGATATPTPGPGFTFGGSSANPTFTAGQTSTVNLAAYMGISVSIAFPAPSSPSSFTLGFADAVNNGDITPAGFVADNATAGYTPILYMGVTNSTNTNDAFGNTSPAFTITDTNASFASFTTCELDVYSHNGGPTPIWHMIASGSRSGTTVTVPSVSLGASQTLNFQPGQQSVAISCH